MRYVAWDPVVKLLATCWPCGVLIRRDELPGHYELLLADLVRRMLGIKTGQTAPTDVILVTP